MRLQRILSRRVHVKDEEKEQYGNHQYNEDAWNNRLRELVEYKNTFSDTNVPRYWAKNKQLACWVKYQRELYKLHQEGKQTSLTMEQIKSLNNIGFDWRVGELFNEIMWNTRLSELEKYKHIVGDTNVPTFYAPNQVLSYWVCYQRKLYKLNEEGKKTALTMDRIKSLNKIGFDRRGRDYYNEIIWNTRLRELTEYKNTFSDTNVPQNWAQNKQLGRWVYYQRKLYKLNEEGKKTALTIERINSLEKIGFNWGKFGVNQGKHLSNEIAWNTCLSELAKYKKATGDVNVSCTSTENKILNNWVRYQRKLYKLHKEGKKTSLTMERIKSLNHIGFEWNHNGKEQTVTVPAVLPTAESPLSLLTHVHNDIDDDNDKNKTSTTSNTGLNDDSLSVPMEEEQR